ncbi:MAG: aminotransferase class III-fold pyridoxal phosphate-dependent enzyme, partial [Aldersonia sp.]|nr:aminotransferase class III-fold pyridoxal phosphate-dependent enzyme [Aldersonia sp.]
MTLVGHDLGNDFGDDTAAALVAAQAHSARNYDPLPVVLASGRGAWLRDVHGTDYLDLLAGYSAVNFGHAHPVLVKVAQEQIARLTLTSRAFQHERFAAFCAGLARLCGKDAVLPMNTGSEAVETALKVARKWGYERKGVPPGAAEVITCAGNFHGRTITIVGFSTDPDANTNFGPYPAGFVTVAFGDAAAIESAITENTVAVLIEPIQG